VIRIDAGLWPRLPADSVAERGAAGHVHFPTTLSKSLVGDWPRDRLDPRLRR